MTGYNDKIKKFRNTILCGDVREKLKELPDESVHCCVTSPPYFGLRDYGTASWSGGDPNCNHVRDNKISTNCITGHKKQKTNEVSDAIYKHICKKCGATCIDKQIGLEETPEDYIESLVGVFREVKRVLRRDGILWINIGDSYAQSGGSGTGDYALNHKQFGKTVQNETLQTPRKAPKGLKPKDLIGIPWMLAFALRKDGWYLRQDIIWYKPNPLPESVADRCTKSHEYIFLLSKSPTYFYDAEAIKENSVDKESYTGRRFRGRHTIYESGAIPLYSSPQSIHSGNNRLLEKRYPKRNKRSVWTVNVEAFKESHFAVFPKKLITPCIKAGTSLKGCCADCGVPWKRIIEHNKTVNWEPSCTCKKENVPCIVLDPFMGAGTTGIAAIEYGQNYIGIELNPKFVKMAEKRIQKEKVKIDNSFGIII